MSGIIAKNGGLVLANDGVTAITESSGSHGENSYKVTTSLDGTAKEQFIIAKPSVVFDSIFPSTEEGQFKLTELKKEAIMSITNGALASDINQQVGTVGFGRAHSSAITVVNSAAEPVPGNE